MSWINGDYPQSYKYLPTKLRIKQWKLLIANSNKEKIKDVDVDHLLISLCLSE